MFNDYPPLLDVLNQTPIKWELFISNLKAFQEDKKKEFQEKTHWTPEMTETLEYMVKHNSLGLEPKPSVSRRDFLKGTGALFAGAALYAGMPKSYAQAIEPNIDFLNYKQFIYSHGNSAVLYTLNKGKSGAYHGPDGDLFFEALRERLKNRKISFYKIDMSSWPEEYVQDWIRNENEKDTIPSLHIIINNVRELRVRGPPSGRQRDDFVNRVDSLLKNKGI